MPDHSDVPQTPYAVALKLAEYIAFAEDKQLGFAGGVTREYVLQLYRECLEAVASQNDIFTPGG
jgi:hypothetical protein